MENKELDDLLNSALVPSVTASSQLNQSIFKACENNNGKAVKRNGKKIKTMRLLPRVAVFVLIFSLGGAISVYAATHLFRKVNVSDFKVTTDNISPDRVKALSADEAKELFGEEAFEFSEEVIKEEKPGEGDLWTKKKEIVQKFGSRENTIEKYWYDDYMKAEEAEGFERLFKDTEGFIQRGMGAYETYCQVYKLADDSTDPERKMLWSEMGFKGGMFNVQYFVNDEEGFTMASAGEVKYENKRSYVSESGAEFELWDNSWGNELSSGEIEYIPTMTQTIISFGNTNVIISFNGLDDEQIHMILDKIDL